MNELLRTLFAGTISIIFTIAVAKYLIRYAAKVFAEEFEKRFK